MESEARVIYSEYYLAPEKLYVLIGKNIKQLRKKHGMTQDRLAELVDTDQKHVYVNKKVAQKGTKNLTVLTLHNFSCSFA